ncbi:vacuolar protein sorting-associated protein 35 [Ancylostoma caninum]|uniref:Vacuolar protein sorting-associated protein 35 n=1 Tax=Ancylostoma caninum TaxID=29170 RepID=A0A368GRN2_ANCCA|nr:vacuolar protein sorting-associated protein 35 [Ancylostoma caninum]
MKNDATINSEQEKLLDNAIRVLKAESLEMKRCLDRGETMDALKHASQFLSELKTSDLSPKFYYRLYMDASNELQQLEFFLVDEHKKDKTKIDNLYECVQYAGAIIPRLYLLITIGVVIIKCGADTRRNILSDLVEMCRGVQHPLRGLFLRHYLLQSTKTLLPDNPDLSTTEVNDLPESDKEPRECDGTVSDAIHFVLVNFAEMNKLWVRMQHQGPSREREKREKDRLELRILVGLNLVRLSELQNLTEEMYMKEVLPSILEQVVSCRDHISQEYLMECVIQVFGDDFHLTTLNEFLRACGDLVPEVNVKNILIALIERLAHYAANPEGKGIPAEIQLFDIFSDQAKNLVTNRPDMPLEDIVSLYAALVNLAIKCYPDKPEFANISFGSLKSILEEKKKTAIEPFDAVGRELMKLVRLPVDEYNNALKVAELTEFVPVMECFNYHGRCLASSYIIQNMLEHGTLMRTEENVAVMCAVLHSLLVDQQDQPSNATENEDFEDEQHLVARLVHLIQADSPDEQFLLLNNARKILGAGGKIRIKYTLAPIVFELYKLILRFVDLKDEENWEAKMRKMFMCAMGTIGALITTAEMSDLPLKLYLEGAMVADKVPMPDASSVVYEFIAKAMSVFEDEISESRERISAMSLITGTMLEIRNLPSESWHTLAGQIIVAASAKMFKKADQVRTLCTVVALYWKGETAESGGPMRNGDKVVEVLKKAGKIATQCLEPIVQQQLFVLIINTLLYYYEDNCLEVTEDMLVELISRTKDNAVQLDVSAEADALEKHLAMTLQHIKRAKDKRPGLAERLQL